MPIKLSSNESALGPSPEGVEAFDDGAVLRFTSIPTAARRLLRETIGEAYGLNPERIVCGNGSDELLTLLADAYLRPGDEVLFSEHAFLLYRIATLANSAMPVVVPEKNLRVDVDAMLKAVSAAHAHRLSRQSEQSDRQLSHAARTCAACMPACRHRRFS